MVLIRFSSVLLTYLIRLLCRASNSVLHMMAPIVPFAFASSFSIVRKSNDFQVRDGGQDGGPSMQETSPQYSVAACNVALEKKQFNHNDALEYWGAPYQSPRSGYCPGTLLKVGLEASQIQTHNDKNYTLHQALPSHIWVFKKSKDRLERNTNIQQLQ